MLKNHAMADPQRAAASWPGPSLQAWLVLMMLVASVPLALLMAWQLFNEVQAQHRRLDESLQGQATALTASLERELTTTREGLMQLSQRLQRSGGEPLPALRDLLREQALPSHWQAVYLRTPDGQSRWPDDSGALSSLPPPVEGGVSGLLQDGRSGTAIEVPFMAEDGQRHALGTWIDAAFWQRLADGSDALDGRSLLIVDRDGRTIARSGGRAAAEVAASSAGGAEGVRRVALVDGSLAYHAARVVPSSGWQVSARVAAEPIDSAHRQAVLAALATTAGCLLLGVALATLLARRFTEPLTALVRHGPSLPVRPAMREIAQLRDALAAAQEQEALARARLQCKADEFQALFASTPVGLAYRPDRSSSQVLHNAAMDALVGPPGEGDAAQLFGNGKRLTPAQQPLQRAMDSGQEVGPVELELHAPGAATRHVLVRAVPLPARDGRTCGAVAAMVEITERKRAEQRLLESDQRLQQSLALIELAQDAVDVGFFQYRFDTAAGSWTPSQARLWGFEPGAPPPSPESVLQRVHADDRRTLRAHWRALIDSGGERGMVEYRIAHGHDAPRWLSTRVMLSYDGARQPSQMVGVTLDISDHKRAESERAALIAAEQAARQQAEAASRAKDEFLAMLGHELRNPLGAIASAVEVLNRADAQAASAANARLIIGRQTRHLARLMDDLLDVGRVISGKVLLSTQRIELGALVERVLANFELTGTSHQHDVHRRLEPVWVEADTTRIEQVVGNLLGNAFKYTPPGRRVEVVTSRRDGRALLEVRDQGPGIPAALLPRIFDLFVQSQQSIDRPGGGLGIGLTLVRRLVELHGGRVTARSSDQGTTFEVALPAVEAPRFRGAAPDRVAAARAAGRRQRRRARLAARDARARRPRGQHRGRRRARPGAAAG
jgi:signal transduction histidine kinase